MTLNLDKSAWKRVTFGEVIENVTDRVDDPSKAGVDRYVGLEHLDPGTMTVQRWDSPDKVEAQKLRFQPGDVIFGRRRAYQKKVAQADFEGICSAHALVLRARPGCIHPDFLPVFLSSDYFLDRAIAISVGSLSPTVNWRDLKVQEFDLSPLDEQKRIADLLWSIERHRGALNATADALRLSATMLIANLRATHSATKNVRDVATVRNGQNYPKRMQDGRTGAVPFFKVADLDRPGNERYLTNPGGWITADDVAALSADILPAGTVVTARVGAAIRLERRRALASPALVDENHLVIRPHGVDPEYLLALLAETELARSSNGGVVPSLNQQIVGAVVLPDVSPVVEAQIGATYRLLGDTRDSVLSEVASLNQLRTAVLSAVFGGS